MGALNPLFFLAAAAVAVPLYLHLFQRHETRRVSFPALRYLARTERDHARRIRFRQLLLLLLRVGVMMLLVGAGARLFLRGSGSAHPPTALAIVLDNSMSSGVVVGEERRLDHLKELAYRSLAVATPDDRVWVIRAGEPWLPAVPGGPEDARRIVEETVVSAGAGNLTAAVARARELVETSDLPAREIHLLSDLQATGFPEGMESPAGETPVLVWNPQQSPPANRAITRVLIGGGLPPLEGQRSEIAIDAAGGSDEDTVGIPVRVVLSERVRGAGILPPGASLVLPLPAAPPGWVLGYADADPDALRADDRRFFAFHARPAPAVTTVGDPGIFVMEALAVLEASGRVRRTSLRDAQAILSASGEGLESVGAGSSVLILPPSDPTLLPSLNRRLQDAGVPWRLERIEASGETELSGDALPDPLRRVRVRQGYRPVLVGDPTSPPRTLAFAGGQPWAIEGRDGSGRRFLLLGSALDDQSTSLPVSADMIRFLDWLTSEWAALGSGAAEHVAGSALSAPRDADAVRLPSGEVVPLDGTRMVRGTREAGIYTFQMGDSAVGYEAVNPPGTESNLTPLDEDLTEERIGTEVTHVRREGAWDGAIYRVRQGPELWRPLLIAGLLALLIEAAVAATGSQGIGRRAKTAPEAVRAGS